MWKALLTIPAGATCSYAELAAQIGQPKAVRAVGRANGDNRLSIVVPCHRVIGADGALTGYGGGLPRKQKLLDLERAAVPRDRRPLPMPLPRARAAGILAALWGGSFVFMRVAVPALGPCRSPSRALRSPTLALLAIAFAQRRMPDFRARWREFAVVGIVNSAMPFVLFCLRRAVHHGVDGRDPQCDEPVLRRDRRGDLARRSR